MERKCEKEYSDNNCMKNQEKNNERENSMYSEDKIKDETKKEERDGAGDKSKPQEGLCRGEY